MRKSKHRPFLKFGDPKSIAAIAKLDEESTPIEKMHVSFGVKTDFECGSCRHYKLDSYDTVRCDIYQQTEDVRGRWEPHWVACGKWKR